jgi:hypothetical protein
MVREASRRTRRGQRGPERARIEVYVRSRLTPDLDGDLRRAEEVWAAVEAGDVPGTLGVRPNGRPRRAIDHAGASLG